MGTGLLLCREQSRVSALICGGTGSHSLSLAQPEELPDRLESGTVNVPGICGIRAGVEFVRNKGQAGVYAHELRCLQYLYDRIHHCPALRTYTPRPQAGATAPVLSVNIQGCTSEETAALLNNEGIAVRAGLHCAPSAHRRFGTLEQGTVRLAPSAFSTLEEAAYISEVFYKIAQKRLH